MLPILLLTASVILHLLGVLILIKHRRNLRHHRAIMPTIGRHPKLTDALHARLSDNAPQSDWRSPHTMRAKVNAWLRRNAS